MYEVHKLYTLNLNNIDVNEKIFGRQNWKNLNMDWVLDGIYDFLILLNITI